MCIRDRLLAEAGGRVDSTALRLIDVKSGVELGRVVPGLTAGVPTAFRPRAVKAAFSPNGRYVAVSVQVGDNYLVPGGAALWDTCLLYTSRCV